MLRDLMHCKLASLFLDIFFNKFQEMDGDGQETAHWDKYLAKEFDFLVSKEVAAVEPPALYAQKPQNVQVSSLASICEVQPLPCGFTPHAPTSETRVAKAVDKGEYQPRGSVPCLVQWSLSVPSVSGFWVARILNVLNGLHLQYYDFKLEYNDVTVQYIEVTMPYYDIIVPYIDVIMQYYHNIEQCCEYDVIVQYCDDKMHYNDFTVQYIE
ncbi:hypothetical protein STEG23_003699, partial [Scotinomys teguina]